jgi:hypothetical protein
MDERFIWPFIASVVMLFCLFWAGFSAFMEWVLIAGD